MVAYSKSTLSVEAETKNQLLPKGWGTRRTGSISKYLALFSGHGDFKISKLSRHTR
jgi:hypothetical protein